MSTEHIKYTDPRNEIADLKTLLAMANERNDKANARIAELESAISASRNSTANRQATANNLRDDLTAERTAHLATRKALVEIAEECASWADAFRDDYKGGGVYTDDLLKEHAEAINAARTAVAQAEGGKA